MILNVGQTMLLKMIEEARAEERALVEAVEAEMRARLKALKEGEGYKETHALMREAYEAGISKRQIGAAYGSSDPGTVNRVLAATPHAPDAPKRLLAFLDRAEVIHTYLRPGDPDFPAFLGENRTFSKIQATFPENGPFSKIRGLSAVVDPAYKICYVSEPTPLTDLIDGPRENWPTELEDVLGPVLDNYNPQA